MREEPTQTRFFPPVPFDPGLTASDREALRAAVGALERQSFAARMATIAGRQFNLSARAIPPQFQEAASDAARTALSAAMKVALSSLRSPPRADTARLHRRLAALCGGVGGAVGLACLPLELPVSTTIMLRSIADIARHEGEDIGDPRVGLACLEVFALGGHAAEGNVMEGGYLAIRGLLAKSVSDAVRYTLASGAANQSAPALARLLGLIAGRFGLVVSQKAAAQAVPLIGAISGAAINVAFTEHFQTLARGHFAVRRLERLYGPQLVQSEYARIAREEGYWDRPRPT